MAENPTKLGVILYSNLCPIMNSKWPFYTFWGMFTKKKERQAGGRGKRYRKGRHRSEERRGDRGEDKTGKCF